MSEINPEILDLARKRRAALAEEAKQRAQHQTNVARNIAAAEDYRQRDKDQRHEGLARLIEDASYIGELALQKSARPNLHIVKKETMYVRTWWGADRIQHTKQTLLAGWELFGQDVQSKPHPVTRPDPDPDGIYWTGTRKTVTTMETSALKRVTLLVPRKGLYVADCEAYRPPSFDDERVAHVSGVSTLEESPVQITPDKDIHLPELTQLEIARHSLAAIVEAYDLAALGS